MTQLTALGHAMGDYYYVYTQKGPLGYLPEAVRNAAQLMVLYSMASQLSETVRTPILTSLAQGIHQQASQVPGAI